MPPRRDPKAKAAAKKAEKGNTFFFYFFTWLLFPVCSIELVERILLLLLSF